MLTDSQLAQCDRDGWVTLDTPFTADEVASAADAMDAMFKEKGEGFLAEVSAPELVHLMLHPFVEQAARAMLRADKVALRAMAIKKSAPHPDRKPVFEGEHADIRFSAADMESTPRNMLCSILIWLTDVTPRRAPLMFRPGSHRQLAQLWTEPPRIDAHRIEKLPDLPWADAVPVLAQAGQISVGTTGTLHSASTNVDTRDRKVIFTQWQAKGLPSLLDGIYQEQLEKAVAAMSPAVAASRRHLIEL